MINSSKAATQLIKEEKALSYVHQKNKILIARAIAREGGAVYVEKLG